MKRIVSRAALVCVSVTALVALALGAAAERTLSIRAVMQKQYRVTRAPFVLIKRELASTTPDWEKVGEAARDFSILAATLEKNEPKWGEKDSWQRFLAVHIGDAKAMEDAAAQRDRAALQVVHRRLETACDACHKAHRTPRKE